MKQYLAYLLGLTLLIIVYNAAAQETETQMDEATNASSRGTDLQQPTEANATENSSEIAEMPPLPVATVANKQTQPAAENNKPSTADSLKDDETLLEVDADTLTFKIKKGIEQAYTQDGDLFTGVVKLPDEQNFATVYFYENGKKQGVAVSHYDNKQIRLETTYAKGRKNGAEIMFYENGKTQYQRNYKDDIIDGNEVLFYENGTPKKRSFYVNGVLNDKVQYFDRDGNLIKIETYQNGVKEGPEEIIENGRLREEYSYQNGKLSGVAKKYNEKYLIEEIPYKNGLQEGIRKTYSEKGNSSEIPYVRGKRHGQAIVYYSENKPAQKVWYVGGKKNGIDEKFFKNGQTSSIENYKNDKLDGAARYFNENGDLTTVKYYIDGAEMAAVDLQTDAQLKELYDAYKEGKLSHYSSKRDLWYTILWLALSTQKEDMLQSLEKEMNMLALTVDDIEAYKYNNDTFEDVSRRLFFGLSPFSYAIILASPQGILRHFNNQLNQPNARGTTSMQEAIRLNDESIIQYLLALQSDISHKDEQGNTALFYALKSNAKPEIIKLLLEAGSDVNTTDNYNKTPLEYALEQNLPSETIMMLINAGAKIDGINNELKDNILLQALKNNQAPEMVNLLLELFPDQTGNTDKKGHSVLFYAIHNNYDSKIIDTIINKQQSISAPDIKNIIAEVIQKQDTSLLKKLNITAESLQNVSDSGQSALWYAYEQKAPKEMIDYLWQQGVALNGIGYLSLYNSEGNDSLLMTALRNNDRLLITRLLRADVLSDAMEAKNAVFYILTHKFNKDITNMTLDYITKDDLLRTVTGTEQPIWKYLLINRKFELLSQLVDRFEDLLTFKDENGEDMITMALNNPEDEELKQLVLEKAPVEKLFIPALQSENKAIIKHVIAKMNNLNATDQNGYTPLILAISGEARVKDIETLLKMGADINYIANDGTTALYMACKQNQPELVQFLLKNGADINTQTDDKSCLMIVTGEMDKLTNLLLQQEIDISYQTTGGKTILMAAAQNLNLPLLNYALEHGADVNAIDADNRNALMYLLAANADNAELYSNIFDRLLQTDIDIDHRNSNGETALILLAKDKPELFMALREKLMEKGADAGLKDQYGKTAADYYLSQEKK